MKNLPYGSILLAFLRNLPRISAQLYRRAQTLTETFSKSEKKKCFEHILSTQVGLGFFGLVCGFFTIFCLFLFFFWHNFKKYKLNATRKHEGKSEEWIIVFRGQNIVEDTVFETKYLLLLWYINSWESWIFISLRLKCCSENWIRNTFCCWDKCLLSFSNPGRVFCGVWIVRGFFPHVS